MAAQPTINILSPALDQSMYIAGLVKAGRPNARIVGHVLPGEYRPRFGTPFDAFVAFDPDSDWQSRDLIPTGARSTELMLERGDITLGEVTLSQSARDFYEKSWSLDLAKSAGVPIPQTWTKSPDIGRFPVFYKSTREGGGVRGVAWEFSKLPSQQDDLIFQEYIQSEGTYGVTFLAEAGKVVVTHAHFERDNFPALGGSAILIERSRDQRLVDHARRIIEASSYSGWGLVEFKYCPSRDDFVFMELNSKFWATTEFAFRNEPAFGQMLFGARAPGAPVERMVIMHRAFQRGLGYSWNLLRHLPPHTELSFVHAMWPRALFHATRRSLLSRPSLTRNENAAH